MLEDLEKARLEEIAHHEPKVLHLRSEFWSLVPLTVTYATASNCLTLEAFLGMRTLEGVAYINVVWMTFIPYI